MKLTFFGAARAVTGSCHMLEACGKRILIDCGLQQGRDETDDQRLPFEPGSIDAVIVTHAHIDHSGRLPLLVKGGFAGPVYTTRLTARLLGIMLRDSAHIQESEAQWQNQKGCRAGRPAVEPLYTMADAEAALGLLKSLDYGQAVSVFPGIELSFTDAGHLLGSAFALLGITEGSHSRKLVFSGDIGNRHQPIIRDPQPVTKADFVIMESTYGNRNHQGGGNYTADLAAILDETFARGGNVIIPSFAVGRAQELLYFIRIIKKYGMVKSVPNFPVYVDSPLAKAATRVFSGDLTGYMDDEAQGMVGEGEQMLLFPGLRLTETTEESRALNADRTPKVIISASGMCDAGRIRHHLKHNLWRPESTVVFVGFQAVGSFGRLLQDRARLGGQQTVRLLGEEIALRADIRTVEGLSSHADRDGLLKWLGQFDPKPRHVFVVHGDSEICTGFASDLRDMGYSAHSPMYLEEYDLIADMVTHQGIEIPKKKHAAHRESPAYLALVEAGQLLAALIVKSKGLANKDLARFAGQIRALIAKWQR